MDRDDLDFGTTKRSAKQGRRAAVSTPSVTATAATDIEQDEELSAPIKQNGSSKDRPNKAVSGWGEDAPRKPRERLRPSSPDKGSEGDSDTDIPVIPELEEQQEEDLTTRVASAPNVAVNRVATYRELDNDLLRQAAFQILDNEIDLKLLTKGLSPAEDLIEEDRPWDWDRLFTEISSELTTEWEKAAGETNTEQAET
ncbi:intraflagellar transport protein 43 homolog A-like isoform X3 [Pomacea canaliculata]|uniref:intraflagellar transport protein 43 homolog A-like isoform X3 n=1 Tax=Pomacea canaliculata TaxID=400727 RepID=UPI000D72C6BC|nr:intraflagellar transport protein 43 homolog A-like isoform X3 [Pomacea canaliculata]